MKIVLAGPSGSGKTTLAKAIAKKLNLTFIENSAGLVMLPEDKAHLKSKYAYENKGQVNVINQSHLNPEFGSDFQRFVLNARKRLLQENDNVVLDRSPLDPIAFYLNQVVHNHPQTRSKAFIEHCAHVFLTSGITHVIRVPLLDPSSQIEDDGSRVSNWYFQKKVDLLFDLAIEFVSEIYNKGKYATYEHTPFISFHRVGTWNWDERLNRALNFINTKIPSTI